MSVETKKQSRENNQGLVRRFSKRVKQSGVLKRARKNQFVKKEKSPKMKKKSALRREEIRKSYLKAEKMSKPYRR